MSGIRHGNGCGGEIVSQGRFFDPPIWMCLSCRKTFDEDRAWDEQRKTPSRRARGTKDDGGTGG